MCRGPGVGYSMLVTGRHGAVQQSLQRWSSAQLQASGCALVERAVHGVMAAWRSCMLVKSAQCPSKTRQVTRLQTLCVSALHVCLCQERSTVLAFEAG